MDNENINRQEESEIEFNYIKSNNFRVIHADGAVGDGTPRGDLFLVFYNERFPLPDSQTFNINKEGKIVSEVLDKRQVKSNGVMREVEVGITIDVNVAKGIVVSLSRLIRQLEAEEIQAEKAEDTEH